MVGRQRRCGNWKVYSAIRFRPYREIVVLSSESDHSEDQNFSGRMVESFPARRGTVAILEAIHRRLPFSTQKNSRDELKAPPMGDLIVPGMLSKLMMRVTHSRAFTVAPVVYAALKTMEVNWDSIFH